MSQSRKNSRSASVVPLYAAQPRRTQARRRAGALLMGTTLSAVIGLSYGRGVHAQTVLSGSQTDTQTLNGPDEFVTEDGFSVDTSDSSGDAITITTGGGEKGDTTFTDNYASMINGAGDGILAVHSGTGELRLTTTGDVAGGNYGVRSINNTISGALSIAASGSLRGGKRGIRAMNAGGALTISLSGSVTGESFDGIFASNAGAELVVDANKVTGGTRGMLLVNNGSGALTITASGAVTGEKANGIGAYNSSQSSTDLTIEVDNVTGGNHGIQAYNDGSGALSITASGAVTGETANGIGAFNSQNSTDLTIEVNNVTGGSYGIDADNQGSSALTITASGAVTGETDAGIDAYNSQNSTDLTIEVDNVTGGSYGIFAQNQGSSALSIMASGAVTGETSDGISAANSQNSTDLTIEVNKVTGGDDGIRAYNFGSGALSITASGAVTGKTKDGIFAYNAIYSTDLTVEVNNVTGSNEGIFAYNNGSGALSITASGAVTGGGSYDGIDARNSQNSTDLTIEVNNVTGGSYGIDADNQGSSALSITASGAVTGETDAGIDAYNSQNSTDLTIEVDNVTGGNRGMLAVNNGSGALSITTSGAVTGETSDGILAYNSLNSTGLTIEVNNVTGGDEGIFAYNDGSGALSITASGAVTGGTYDGIYANNASTEDLTITIGEGGSVSTSGTDNAYDFAIEAVSNNGAVIVNNFGTVTGRVNLTNSNTFTNTGIWDLADTTSDFNANGNSLVVNEGLIIAASNGAAAETSVIDNLDIFRSNAGGTIRLADGAAGDVFQIANTGSGTGNFVANGGTVQLDAVLGGDGSAADKLDISGDVTLVGAPTALALTPVGGGTGGETTTGIEVVTVGGTSDAGAFVLAAPVEVGALAYDLSLGQCDDTANVNWYLCNNGTIGTTGAVFEAMPGVILGNFAQAQALSQRLGSRITTSGATVSTRGTDDLSASRAIGPWMRTSGMQQDVTPETSTSDVSLDSSSFGVEFGLGASLGVVAGGDLVGGLSFESKSQTTNLENTVGTGQIDMQGRGVGLSLTWFGQDGLYVDLNAGRDWIELDASSQGGGMLLDGYEDVVNSASGEVGKRFALEGGTTFVPQVQLAWSQMEDGNFTDSLGNSVTFADRETLTGRVGLSVEQNVDINNWGSGKVYGFGNVHADLSGNQTVEVAGTELTQSGGGNWAELGTGFSLSPDGETNLFGEVSYRSAVADVDGRAVSGSLGWRVQW